MDKKEKKIMNVLWCLYLATTERQRKYNLTRLERFSVGDVIKVMKTNEYCPYRLKPNVERYGINE